MGRIEGSRSVAAPVEVVWDVIVDPDVYETVAPNLAEVALVSEPGPGMVRRCVDSNGNEWTETCTHWEAGRSYGVAVDVETSDFHRRWFTRFEGTWSCEPRAEDVRLTIAFEFETRYGPLGRLFSKALERKAGSLVEAIFDGWEREIEDRLAGTRERAREEASGAQPETSET